MNLVTVSIVVATVAALFFVFFGEVIVGSFSAVRRLRMARAECENWKVNQSASGHAIRDVCEMRLAEVSEPPNTRNGASTVKHIRFGNIAVIVHYKDRHVRHSIGEVRFYAGVFLAFFFVACLWVAKDVPVFLSFDLLSKLSENHLFPILEAIMIVLWIIRLGGEVRSINYLFEH